MEAMESRLLLSSTVRWGDEPIPVEPGQWLLRMHAARGTPSRQLRALASALHVIDPRLHVTEHLGRRGLVLVQAPRHLPYKFIERAARKLRGFVRLEPNFTLSSTSLPNDPRFNEQYALHNTGQSAGTPGADIDATDAWDFTTGDSSVIVGVLDSGVDYNHPDLVHAIWSNPGEIAGDGIDNDNNGFIDDVRGWDFSDDDATPMDQRNHGTHIAGIIAAAHNSIGVAGIAPGVKIMPLRILDQGGNGTVAGAIAAINYATTMRNRGVNIRVTNNSWGQYAVSHALYDAIEEHEAAGILFVAAAGNLGKNIEVEPFNPAAYNLPNIISVVSTDNRDGLSGFSNYGAWSTDIGAPGTRILSTFPNNSYGLLDGTSTAAPHVVGIAALAFSISPPDTPYAVIRDAILSGGDPLSALVGKTTTGRRANAYNTLLQLPLLVLNSTPAVSSSTPTTPTQFTVTFSHPIDAAALQASHFTVDGTPATSLTFLDSRTVRFNFASSPVVAQGPQAMSLADGAAIRLADGAPMDDWTSSFWYDVTALQVTSSDPATGVIAPPLTTLELSFSDQVLDTSLDPSDLTLSHGWVSDATLLDPTTIRFTVSGLEGEANVTWSLPAGALTDLHGNPSRPATGAFTLDHPNRAVPVPLNSYSPSASRVHSSVPITGFVHGATDIDRFTITLDPGQTLSVEVAGEEGLLPRLSIHDSAGDLLADSPAPTGPRAILQHVPVAAGAHTISISGAAGGSATGHYTLRLWLNASIELESHGGPFNHIVAAAQPLPHADLVSIAGRTEHPPGVLPQESEPNETLSQGNLASHNFTPAAAGRYHLLMRGEIPTTSDQDVFSLGALSPDDVLTITLLGDGTPRGSLFDPFLELFRGDPTAPIEVDTNNDSGTDHDSLLRITIAEPDNYFIRVRPFPNVPLNPGETGNYHLSALLETTRVIPAGPGVNTESEPNSSFTTPDDISTLWSPIQHLSSTTGTIATNDTDYIAYTFNAGDLVTIRIAGQDGVNPAIRLRNSAGNILAYDDGLAPDDPSSAAILGLSILTTDTYYLEILAAEFSPPGMSGAYTAGVYLSTNIAPPAPPATIGDLYSFNLAAGESISSALAFAGPGASLQILDAAGDLVASAIAPPPGGDITLVLSSFTAPAAGLYHLHVIGPADQDYTLTLARDSAIDLEPNDNSAASQPLLPNGAIGYLSPGDQDYFHFSASAGDVLHLGARVPASGPGEFPNLLDPTLELYSPSGALLDSASDSLVHTAAETGVYRVRLSADDTSGAYSLALINFTTGFRGTPNTDIFHLRLQPSGQFLDLRLNDTTYTLPTSALTSLKLLGSSGADQLIVDSIHGNPLASRSLSLTGHFSINLVSNPDKVLRFSNLSIAPGSTFDLLDNDLILTSASPTDIQSLITSNRLISSVTTVVTTLASTLNDRGDNSSLLATFSGQPVTKTDVLVKFTYVGDANLDGRVTIADYLRADRGSARDLTGWVHGDFNRDGSIDGADFFLLDQSFLTPGPVL